MRSGRPFELARKDHCGVKAVPALPVPPGPLVPIEHVSSDLMILFAVVRGENRTGGIVVRAKFGPGNFVAGKFGTKSEIPTNLSDYVTASIDCEWWPLFPIGLWLVAAISWMLIISWRLLDGCCYFLEAL